MRFFLSLAGVAPDSPKRRTALGSVSPPEDLQACLQGAGHGNFRYSEYPATPAMMSV